MLGGLTVLVGVPADLAVDIEDVFAPACCRFFVHSFGQMLATASAASADER